MLVDHRRTSEMISFILSSEQSCIEEAARLCIELPIFVHSINLVRWFAQFRNGGRYNEDCYLTSAHWVNQTLEKQTQLKHEAADLCPTIEALQTRPARGAKPSLKRQATRPLQLEQVDISLLREPIADDPADSELHASDRTDFAQVVVLA